MRDPLDDMSTLKMPPVADASVGASAPMVAAWISNAVAGSSSALDVEELTSSLERRLLANEVHDSVAQNLTRIRMRMVLLRDAIACADMERAAACAAEMDSSIAGVQANVRAIITHFRTEMEVAGLGPALQAAVDELHMASGVEIDFTNLLRGAQLSVEEEQQIFYIAREALTNALKYAQANCIGMILLAHDGVLELMITDDGVGLDSGKALADGHFGLRIMRERARRLGANIDIEHCPRGGTRVRLVLALQSARSRENA